VKLWNAQSGFCFVTFTQHTAGVTDAAFSQTSGNSSVLFTCSLDGTVRAFDLVRYRCFKTFTSPEPVQFNCLAIDPSGEVICAASLDTFQIFVWSVVTGNLLDIYSGHEGPIASLSFSPSGDGKLASASWDKVLFYHLMYRLFESGMSFLEMQTSRSSITSLKSCV
jgi:periodic tryptophan protein 2